VADKVSLMKITVSFPFSKSQILKTTNFFRFLISLAVSIIGSIPLITAQNVSFSVDTKTKVVDAFVAPYNQIKPGDTIFLLSGKRDFLQIKNITGSFERPVVIINKGGIVEISTNNHYGLSLQNCRFIHLTGQGDPDWFYGIKITHVENGAGIGIGYMSSDYEIDHISIENTPIGGIYAKTDPDCSFKATREKFTQNNTVIHDNYIANVGNEGLYVGSSKYSGQIINCNGKDTLVMPSTLNGVHIYNNIIKHTGWDGLQVSSATNNCHVYNNMVLFDSQAEVYGQMSGILLGGGSKCDCYNNFISSGKGDGIESHGLAGYRIFNNIIVDAGRSFLPFDGSQMKHGIFVSDVSVQKDSSLYILFNDIINPKSDGIRFQSVKGKNNLIASNLIVNPGNYDFYENDNTFNKGQNAYIMFPDNSSNVVVKRNFLTRNIDNARVSKTDFSPVIGSPLIDSAYSQTRGINFDFNYNSRPYGTSSDIGALEFSPDQPGIPGQNSSGNYPELKLYPNFVRSMLTIRFIENRSLESKLTIYTLQGNRVFQKKQPCISGSQQEIRVPVDDLLPGIYLFVLSSGQSTLSGRFIKIN
jgi:hypothetical protein